MAHIIVVGNEKGGAGKSTVSMHVATTLARLG
ncbi:MAG: division plane positioning ATPase MipZ, partial [Pseudomonadota bacterium]|nr:division plane positioning ATPase MipZ [Pseudomonadota bacterium]